MYKKKKDMICRSLHVEQGLFDEMLSGVLSLYEVLYLPVRLVFFGEPDGNDEYHRHLCKIKEAIGQRFGAKAPVVSYVAEAPCGGGLLLEIHEVEVDDRDRIRYETAESVDYLVIENEVSKWLFLGGITGDYQKDTIRMQSDTLFQKIGRILDLEQMPVSSIVRQWNYIERITAFAENKQHYQEFNDSRSVFYQEANWVNGYPAATGIGTQWGGVMVDLIAVTGNTVVIKAIDNPLQIAAHAYSQKVLLGEEDSLLKKRTTPKFERAKSVDDSHYEVIYISGTAAIRDENSLNEVGLEAQTLATLENIDYLISSGNLGEFNVSLSSDVSPVYFRVYLKNKEFYEEARSIVRKHYPDISGIYLVADVCRAELLIEIEGIAITGLLM